MIGRDTLHHMRLLNTWLGDNGPTLQVDFKDLDEQLRYLRRVVTEARMKPQIRAKAMSIIQNAGCPSRDKKCQAIAIGQWVQDNVYYVHELPERFQTPEETLRTLSGDCDDSTVLIACLLETIGIQSQLVCMKIGMNWSHIFPVAIMEPSRKWLPLDSTMSTPISEVPNPVEYALSKGKTVKLKVA